MIDLDFKDLEFFDLSYFLAFNAYFFEGKIVLYIVACLKLFGDYGMIHYPKFGQNIVKNNILFC